MTIKETIIRHRLIISKLRKGPTSFAELADYLEEESRIQEYDFAVSKRTFQRDVNEIFSIYHIEIAYNRRLGKYEIVDEAEDELQERIYEAFDTFNALNVSERLSEHIHFHKRVPTGTEHLYDLLQAVKNEVEVHFDYIKYYESPTSERRVAPLGLKEFRNRWYLVGRDEKDGQVKTFGLERMKAVVITRQSITRPENFDLNEFFRYSYGVIVSGHTPPKPIILRFTPLQGKYIKSQPLHYSQRILIDNDDELRVELLVYPTYDLVMELMSMRNEVEVVEPEGIL